MGQEDIQQILKESVDRESIIGGTFLGAGGRVVASHHVGVDGTIMNLVARDSLSWKKKRGDVFPILGGLVLDTTMCEKMHLGLASVGEDQYVHLVAKPELSLSSFYAKLQEISRKLAAKPT